MRALSIECIALSLALALLGGCATNKDQLLPHGDRTMRDIWQQQTGGGGGNNQRRLLDAREVLRRPLGGHDAHDTPIDNTAYTRTAANEIDRLFHRLPNPDLRMYVFPHLAGSERVPVPGYTTVFPLYRRVPYALPGERQEND